MTKIISIVNLNGGVGKTAIAVNFAAYCGLKGHKTLLVDLDPQTNATFSCVEINKWEAHAVAHGTVANILGYRPQAYAEATPTNKNDIIITEVFKNMDLLPSHLDLFTNDLDLAGAFGRE